MENKHTSVPWEVSDKQPCQIWANGKCIAMTCLWPDYGNPEAYANAEFIVRACNSFDELLEACEEVLQSPNMQISWQTFNKIKQALTKAGRKEKRDDRYNIKW